MADSIEQLRQQEIEAAEDGDVDALLALRTDDFVAMPPGHPPVTGKQHVRAFLEDMFSAVSIRETVTSESVVETDDLAYDRGVFTGEATMKESGTSVPLDGKYLWIARRASDGSWRYTVQMWSDNQQSDSG